MYTYKGQLFIKGTFSGSLVWTIYRFDCIMIGGFDPRPGSNQGQVKLMSGQTKTEIR